MLRHSRSPADVGFKVIICPSLSCMIRLTSMMVIVHAGAASINSKQVIRKPDLTLPNTSDSSAQTKVMCVNVSGRKFRMGSNKRCSVPRNTQVGAAVLTRMASAMAASTRARGETTSRLPRGICSTQKVAPAGALTRRLPASTARMLASRPLVEVMPCPRMAACMSP